MNEINLYSRVLSNPWITERCDPEEQRDAQILEILNSDALRDWARARHRQTSLRLSVGHDF